MGIPEYEARRYDGRVRDGGILLSVHADNADGVKRAKDTLRRTGAENISSTGAASADYAKSDKPMPRSRTSGDIAKPDVTPRRSRKDEGHET